MSLKRTSVIGGFLAIMSVLIGGCATVGVEAVNISKDKVVYERNIEAANNGDPQAQYKVGDALCCSIDEKSRFYDTPKAVNWLCQSARQGYGPAMLKVGRILSGDVVDGIRLARRVAHSVVGKTTNFPVAYEWLRAAEGNGVPEARDRADALWAEMSEQQRAASVEFQSPALPKACTWEEAGLGKSEQT